MISTPATETVPIHPPSPVPAPDDDTHPRLKVQARASRTIRRHFLRATRRILVLGAVDLVLLDSAGRAIDVLRSAGWAPPALAEFFPPGFMGGWGAHAAIVVGLVFAGAYASQERWASPTLVFRGVALGAAIALWQSFDTRGLWWTAIHWITVALALGVLLTVSRAVLHRVVLRYRIATRSGERVILVGDPSRAGGVYAAESVMGWPGVESLGWLSERVHMDDYLGHPSAVWEVLHDTGIDTVVLCDTMSQETFHTVVEAAAVAGCRVLSVRRRATMMATQPRPMLDRRLRLMELTFPAGRAGQALLKRIFDFGVSTFLLVLVAPLFLVLAVLIKLDSNGPVFFVQERVGKAGRIFRMFKFRSMRVGADAEKAKMAHMNQTGDPRLFKIPDDPRITRMGTFLRRWSLDELPQLINVWLGQMSLVGPRPFFEADLAAYDDHHFIRLAVKPGVTGLWQVKGRSSIVDFEEVVELDAEYVERWSFGLDMQILCMTLPAVLRRTGAY